MYPMYQQQWLFPQQPQLNSRFVTNIEEAKASMIDAISTNLFVDTSTGKIYLKKLNNNGQADFFVYAIEEQKPPKDPLEEINTRLTRIENYIGGLNDKSVSNDVQYKEMAHDELRHAGILIKKHLAKADESEKEYLNGLEKERQDMLKLVKAEV